MRGEKRELTTPPFPILSASGSFKIQQNRNNIKIGEIYRDGAVAVIHIFRPQSFEKGAKDIILRRLMSALEEETSEIFFFFERKCAIFFDTNLVKNLEKLSRNFYPRKVKT